MKEFKNGGDTCSLGICSGKGGCGECIADSRRCSTTELGRPEVCDESGHWVPALACSSDQPICDEGNCLAVTDLSLGTTHNCALLSDGQVRCWGENADGQIGAGNKSGEVMKPLRVVGLSDGAQIAVGNSLSCARLGSSELWCWGLLRVPTADPGTNYDQEWLSPHKVDSTVSDLAVSAGPCYVWNSSALCSGDGVGDGIFTGESGEGGTTDPFGVQNLVGVSGISRNNDEVCGLTATSVICADNATPEGAGLGWTVPASPRLRAGHYGTCMGSTTVEGSIRCTKGVDTPRFGVDTPFNAIKPAVGFDHACAISGGTAYCWGACDKGQCGEDRTSTSEVPNAVLSGVEEVYAGNKISCAKKTDGGVVCWGAITSTDVGYQPRAIQWN